MNPFKAALRYSRLKAAWLGQGGVPVPPAQASARALVCKACERNVTRPLWERLTAREAGDLRRTIELHHHLRLATPHDTSIHTCSVCLCYLQLKVHVPLAHVLATTDTDDLPAHCWILRERAALSQP